MNFKALFLVGILAVFEVNANPRVPNVQEGTEHPALIEVQQQNVVNNFTNINDIDIAPIVPPFAHNNQVNEDNAVAHNNQVNEDNAVAHNNQVDEGVVGVLAHALEDVFQNLQNYSQNLQNYYPLDPNAINFNFNVNPSINSSNIVPMQVPPITLQIKKPHLT